MTKKRKHIRKALEEQFKEDRMRDRLAAVVPIDRLSGKLTAEFLFEIPGTSTA